MSVISHFSEVLLRKGYESRTNHKLVNRVDWLQIAEDNGNESARSVKSSQFEVVITNRNKKDLIPSGCLCAISNSTDIHQ